MDMFLSKLREEGYRRTKSRMEILKVLNTHKTPLTPRQIQKEISQKNPDLSTIYRDLNLFEKLNIVERVFTPVGNFYEIKGDSHHGYLICPSCHRISYVPCPLMGKNYPRHQVIFWEICEKCREKGGRK